MGTADDHERGFLVADPGVDPLTTTDGQVIAEGRPPQLIVAAPTCGAPHPDWPRTQTRCEERRGHEEHRGGAWRWHGPTPGQAAPAPSSGELPELWWEPGTGVIERFRETWRMSETGEVAYAPTQHAVRLVAAPADDTADDEPEPWVSGPVLTDPTTGSEGWHDDADCPVVEYVGWNLTSGARVTICRSRELDQETGASLPETWDITLALFDGDGAAPCDALVVKDVTPAQVRSYGEQLIALVGAPADDTAPYRARLVEALGFDEDWDGDDDSLIGYASEQVAQADHCRTRHPADDTAAPDPDHTTEYRAVMAGYGTGSHGDLDSLRRVYRPQIESGEIWIESRTVSSWTRMPDAGQPVRDSQDGGA